MSSKSPSSDSSSNEFNVTRFALDGVVAEMVVEVDDQQELLPSPSKTLKLNGLDSYERLKASALRPSFVSLDPILKKDDVEVSNIESQEQKDSNPKQGETDISKEFQENESTLKSNISDEQEISMDIDSDLPEVKDSDIFKESSQCVEILQKDLTEVGEVTETNKVKLPEQDEDKELTENAAQTVEADSLEEEANKSTFEDGSNTIHTSSEKYENNSAVEEPIETDEVKLSENTNDEPTVEMPEANEASISESSKNKFVEMIETNKTELSAEVADKSAIEKMSETNETQLSEKDGNKSLVEEMTDTNEGLNLLDNLSKSVVEELTKTNETQSSEKNKVKSVEKEECEISEISVLDRLTETVVVGCESIEFELPGMRKSSKLPLKKRKIREPEEPEEDVTDEDEPKTRTLRTRPSEQDKKEEKKTNLNKRKDFSNKSVPVPVKKAKIMKKEILKSKRGLLDENQSERTTKRLRSATQDNPQMQRRSQINSSSKTPETNKRKPELRDKKLELRSTKPETKNKKPEIKTKTPEIKEKKIEVKNRTPELKDKHEMKRQSLRKTTLQKSVPVAITSSKPKVYNLNRGTATNLGIFTEIKANVEESDMKYLRYLYRILFDQWPPKDIDELKKEILNFEGYNFKKKSQDLQKREQVLKKMPDASVAEMCKILDLKVDSKENMISDIIKFLLKPVKIVISTVDPFKPSMQPVVKLKRISLDEFLNKKVKKEKKTLVPVKRSKRERYPSTKLENFVSDISEKALVSVQDEQKKSQTEIKAEKGSKGESSAVKHSLDKTRTAEKNSPKTNKESLTAKYARKKKKATGFKRLSHKKKSKYNQNIQKKLMNLAEKIQKTKSPPKPNYEVTNIDSSEFPETEIKLEPVIEEVREAVKSRESYTKPNVNEKSKSQDSSSEGTLSSDEAKQMTKADSPRKRVSHIRVGKPLRYFSKIKENILNANFSALQRLHILLFGASDKADNLKGNILAFGGFPFLEGSEEWKQKEFLLSLLAQNTLREYLNLLCIEYTDDDQKTLISKLMRFLAAPSDKLRGKLLHLTFYDEEDIRTQVISSEPVGLAPVQAPKVPTKKKVKKVEEKKTRTRKVLMDEAQVKRLEADLAREQRIMERERKLLKEEPKKVQAKPAVFLESRKVKTFKIKEGMESNESLEKKAALTAQQSDAELLNALLQTVYKRRALKKAGVSISAPKKETLTRLGELANVKFLVVTANYSDLDVLHHLIYMTEANKAKVRKNILDFAGFNFAEDSQTYKDRIGFLHSLGYDISKRIAFLLGLCPFKTEIDQQDLNELIMYFLMHPCKSKQIPIRHLPQTFFRKDIPREICQLMEKHMEDIPPPNENPPTSEESSSKKQPEITVVGADKPTTAVPVRQKAKKSFKSSCLPTVRKKGLSPSISTLPLSAPKPLLKPLKQCQPVLLSGPTNKIFLPALGQSPQPTLQKAILNPSALSPAITLPSSPNPPHEVLIQQQTPDGQQKTFKLIKLPANPQNQSVQSRVQSVLKNTPQQAPLTIPAPIQPVIQSKAITFTQPVQVSPVIGGALPPGLIIFKNNPPVTVNQTLPNIMQTVPVMLNTSAMNFNPIVPVANPNQGIVVGPEEEKSIIPVECVFGEDTIEELNPLEDSSPPTDDELFNSIQEVIHSSDFENITLKNVIDRVSAQYSAFDLTPRHMYMKECIKKIIMGT